ncbi:dihydrolipoyl dehydrogenase [Simplicispira psychrophila]|uniref:dihydrolipoyl dehydrogenase n=1 Tax=Simplicispira psychrophila TaxID=80882 RepID=UPI0004892588|nr:dihydrolipoyl dehydrogenase [Simplicispira psychrophila]
MDTPSLDTLIIGAGSAGLAALREVRKRTERFVLINDGPYGTTCARVGCMPSKLLIEAANAYHQRHTLGEFGITGADGLAADLPAVLRRLRRLRDDFVAGARQITDALGARSIAGRARLLGPQQVQVNGTSGTIYHAKSIILAPGSKPVLPPEWRALGDRILTTDTLFEQATLGPRIAVIGLGPVGVELAQALARLGLQVTGYATSEWLGGLSDPAVNTSLHEALARDFSLHTGPAATLHTIPDGSGGISGIEVRSGEHRSVVDHVLVAIGRRPQLACLGLDTLGVALDDKGMPPVNPQTMQIANLPVYLAGDAHNHRPLLHEAADEGHIAGMNALAPATRCYQRRTPLAIVFSDPNAAVIGQSLRALQAQSDLVLVTGSIDFARQGRARASQHHHGRLNVYADQTSGRLLGAELCAPAGEHLAHLLALAIDQQLTVGQLLGMPFYHPVLEEGLRTALRDAARQLDPARTSVQASDLATCDAIGAEALD